MSMTIEQAKSELMQIYGALSPNKQRAIDTLVKIEPCEDAISRQAVLDKAYAYGNGLEPEGYCVEVEDIQALPSVNPQKPKYCDRNICIKNEYNGIGCDECEVTKSREPKIGRCKDCKYFEYDSVARVDGIPLIVAHEICSMWGDGCKTKEGGYCFLFEPKESEDKE